MPDSPLGWFVVVASAMLVALTHLLIRRTSYILELRGCRLALFITLGRAQLRAYFRRTLGDDSPSNAGISFTRERRLLPFNPHRSPSDKRYFRRGNFTFAVGEREPSRYWLASVPYWLPIIGTAVGFALASPF